MNKMPDDAFLIQIYAPAGYGQALRQVTNNAWNGHMLMCKRAIFTDIQKRPELSCPGVYLLYGPDEEDESSKVLYIGEGDSMLPRLQEHYTKKDFWTDMICFSAADDFLTKTYIQYLEARLLERAQNAKRCKLDNSKSMQLPTIAESQRVPIDSFLRTMLDCLTVLGIDFFKPVETKPSTQALFYLSSRGAKANGYESKNGFVVKAGSTTSKDVTKNFLASSYNATRKHLMENGVLVEVADALTLRFSSNHEFSSPSTAASIVCGHNMNGRTVWKTNEDISLKAVQETHILTLVPSHN